VQESNTGIFLREQELSRLRVNNEQLTARNQELDQKVGSIPNQNEETEEQDGYGSMIERDSDGQSVEQLPKPKKKVNFEQKDFEKNLVDVKQTIKETEELIALSR
jgi:hypothetical protein